MQEYNTQARNTVERILEEEEGEEERRTEEGKRGDGRGVVGKQQLKGRFPNHQRREPEQDRRDKASKLEYGGGEVCWLLAYSTCTDMTGEIRMESEVPGTGDGGRR